MVPVKKVKYKINDIKNLEYITNIFFSNKRKMINKQIKKIFKVDEIKKFQDLNLNKRPSDLDKEFYYQATEIYENGLSKPL
jgi:16S rRNA A1518/A1519 N6-dimethyltransferase RsmA/KsgA/DIM1 with predicted DNA glycosylase/AP lyase activity